MRVLIEVVKGTVIHLPQSEDNESDTSSVDTTDSSQPQDQSELDPLGLTQGGPEREEGEWSGHSSSPEAMDQDEVLEHDTYLDGVQPVMLAWPSDRELILRLWTLLLNPRRLRVTPVDPWRPRMHGTTVTILTPRGAKGRTRRLSVIDCTPRYGPTQFLHRRELITGGTKGRT